MNQVLRSFLGLGLVTKESYSLTDRLLGFLTLVPPIFLLLTPLNAASAVVLSIQGYPPWGKCVLGFVAVAFAGGGIVALNNYIDRDRDKAIWPERSIPSGRIKAGSALVSAISLFICSLLFSWFFFNPVNFFILLLAIILGSLYSAYLRDRVGYLSLPPIVGLVYLGGWAAFSPETLFTSPLPWYLYFLGLVWQAAHIMVYYPLHITYGVNGKPVMKLPAFFFMPSLRFAVSIGLGFIILTILLCSLLPLLAPLSNLYLILVLLTGIYALYNGIRFLKNASSKERGFKAFASLTIFRLTISVAILLDILIYHQI
ncbi:MAG: UbiA family prenyltransferase [Dehalococcoidales bacterium]|nr:UbiA family prenyltransferase [Dehalococcoidales bacterium]